MTYEVIAQPLNSFGPPSGHSWPLGGLLKAYRVFGSLATVQMDGFPPIALDVQESFSELCFSLSHK